MRTLLTFIGCCVTLLSIGQTTQQSLRVQITYEKAGQYIEQAVETIEADNTIKASTVVEYRAGHSITMLPGFEARTGSTFMANIKSVNLGKEGGTQLQLTAYPNSFERTTTITYYLPTDGKVNLWITDAQGKIVGQLARDDNQTAGNHQVEWNSQSVSSGVFISILEINQRKAINRLIKK